MYLSCNEEVLFEKSSEEVVANCFFAAGDTCRIHLSTSYNMLSKSTIRNIYNAKIDLFEDGIHIGEFKEETYTGREGYYYFPLKALKAESEYVFAFSTEKGQLIKAIAAAPTLVPIEEVDTSFIIEERYHTLNCNMKFSDPEDEGNYYAIAVDYDDNQIFRPYYSWFSSNSTLIEAELLEVPCNQMIFSDKQIDGNEVNIPIKITGRYSTWAEELKLNYKIMLFSISEDYYKYAISYYEQVLANEDFYAEPKSVFSNIEGGYGIFAGYSKSVKEINIVRKMR